MAPPHLHPETPDEVTRVGDGPPRRTYRSPRLEHHGRLAELTRFGGSEILDSGSGLGQAP